MIRDKTSLINVWTLMKRSFEECRADELIGYKTAMKHLWFFINKQKSINKELEIVELNRRIIQLEMHLDDYAHLIQEQRVQIKDLSKRSGCLVEEMDGFQKVEPLVDGFIIPHFYVECPQEYMDGLLKGAIEFSLSKRIRKNYAHTIRCRMITFFRSRGYVVKMKI